MRSSSWGGVKKDRFEHDRRPLAPAGPAARLASDPDRQAVLVLLVLFSTLSVCLIAKSLAIRYPSVLGDEYYYSILSRYFGRLPELIAHDKYLIDLPNELYLWLFSAVHLLSDDFYQFAKIFNSILFAAAVFPIYATSHMFLRRRLAFLISTLIILAPLDSYTTYFVPESCYFLGFWLFTSLFLCNLPRRAFTAGLMGGFALGLLVLIKPHALAVLAAANLTLITVILLPASFDFRGKDALICLVVLDAAFLLTAAALHIGLFRHRDADIIGFYRGLANLSIPDRLIYARQVSMVALGHLAYAAPIFGLPIVITVLGALGLLPANVSESRSHLRILNVFAIIVFGLLLAMTASATVRFGEFGRIHGRYYDFALPLFLISFYAQTGVKSQVGPRKPLLYAILVCLVLVLVGWMFFAPRLSVYVFDYAEMAWLTQPFPIAGSIFWTVTFMMLGYYLVSGFKETAIYSRYLAVSLIVGTVLIFLAQRKTDQQVPADRGGALIRDLFEGGERDRGLVVGSDLGTIFRCLFEIQANPSVLLLPRGAAIRPTLVGGEERWVLALDDYDLRVPSSTLFAGPGLKIVRLPALAKGVPE